MSRPRRTFTREFKGEAVRRITESGRSLAAVARQLDLSATMLRAGKQARAAAGVQVFPGTGNLPAVAEERRRLRAENQRLGRERQLRKQAPQQNLWVDSDELVTGIAWDRSVGAPWGSFG